MHMVMQVKKSKIVSHLSKIFDAKSSFFLAFPRNHLTIKQRVRSFYLDFNQFMTQFF